MQDETHDPRGDEEIPEALRVAMGAMRERAPGQDALARIRTNLGVPDPSGPGTPPDSPPAPPSGATSGLAGLASVKAIAVAGVAITLGGLWWATTRDDSPVTIPTQVPAITAPAEISSSLPPPAHSAMAPETPSPALSTAAPEKPRRTEASASASPAKGESEVQLIGRAQQLVRSQPQAALALCREHARKFPKGMLVQEREVLIVEALQRMGQEEEARKKSESFLKENPDTALRNKVEHLTADAAP
jgi:hypothetical protein